MNASDKFDHGECLFSLLFLIVFNQTPDENRRKGKKKDIQHLPVAESGGTSVPASSAATDPESLADPIGESSNVRLRGRSLIIVDPRRNGR